MRRIVGHVVLGIVVAVLILYLATGVAITRAITHSNHRIIELRTELGGKPVEEVHIPTEDGLMLSAWYIPGTTGKALVTLSGITESRTQMKRVAETYLGWGFAVLMPDLRATGQSEGERISIGYYEHRDLVACVKWLREKGYSCVGAHGFSLGAATICFAFADLPDLGFAVVESSYDTLHSAIDHRLGNAKIPPLFGKKMDRMNVPSFMAWPFKLAYSCCMGATFRMMSPVEHMGASRCPTLILCGDDEGYLTVAETTSLYERCGSPKKKMHVFKGGHHRLSLSAFPEESQGVIHDFLLNEAGLTLP